VCRLTCISPVLYRKSLVLISAPGSQSINVPESVYRLAEERKTQRAMSSTPVFHLFFTGAALGVRGGSGGPPSKRLLQGCTTWKRCGFGRMVGRTTGVRSQPPGRLVFGENSAVLGALCWCDVLSAAAAGRRSPRSFPTDALGELEKFRNYIEENPVRAGLVREASEYRWSSAGWATGEAPHHQPVAVSTGYAQICSTGVLFNISRPFLSRTHAPEPGRLPHARMPLLVPAASPATSRRMMTQLTFVLLQLADIVTTMTALGNGGHEQNPLVSRFLVIGTLQGLILSKVVLLAAAAAALRFQRFRAIRMANVVFGMIVLWNISVIIRLAWRSHSP
jgi:hypothetical protein